jgi:hypothetical protein
MKFLIPLSSPNCYNFISLGPNILLSTLFSNHKRCIINLVFFGSYVLIAKSNIVDFLES